MDEIECNVQTARRGDSDDMILKDMLKQLEKPYSFQRERRWSKVDSITVAQEMSRRGEGVGRENSSDEAR